MERMRRYVHKTPLLQLLAIFDNVPDAFTFLAAQGASGVDILFLDINLGEVSGLQLLEMMRPQSQVILTTAYSEYAVRGFELSVADYLVKPFTFERFLQAVNRAKSLLPLNTSQNLASQAQQYAQQKSFIFIKTEYRLEKIVLADLLYIEGMRDYRQIHLTDKAILTLQTFSELEADIPAHIACRVHKSYMVALEKIESIERDRIYLKGTGKVVIPISETYKQEFFARIR